MDSFIEVIGIKEENCINCHQCIAVCPVKVCSDGSGEVVKLHNHLCIGCGRCIEACIKSHGGNVEKSARFAIDDAAEFLSDLDTNELVALVAPSAQANFNLKKLISALKLLGVKAVYDVSLGAEISVYSYHEAIESGKVKLPLIAQPCPAIVKYIELNHPALIPHLAPVGSPVHNIAVYAKNLHPEAKLAFISPCLAKKGEFHDSQMVQYNVIFQSLSRILAQKDINIDLLEESEFDNYVSAGIATSFSTPGGLKESYLYHFPDTLPGSISKIEGSLVYEKYLKDLELAITMGQADLPLIIDILSCEKGCNMAAGCINQQQSIIKIERAVSHRTEISSSDSDKFLKLREFLDKVTRDLDFSYNFYRDLSANNDIIIPSELQLQQVYKRMYKENKKDFRNCLACGYNSCLQMAVAVFNGLNKAENCHLYQEKELLREQEILNNMVDELATLNSKLEEEMAERKQQEQLLVQNSKLAAMGEMIGMIAHQWRQPLSSISTLSGNLKVYLDLDMYEKNQFLSLLEEINHHAQYLSSTINDFRHFFKPDNPQDTVYLNTVIENTLGIIGKSLEYKNVQLTINTSFSRPILTYPNELMQVFLNILKNASDAFVDNEVIDPEIRINGYERDSYQVVEFVDNAGGIPEIIMTKIFDPYFSTKGPGIGTGLGLYMSKTIVEEHCDGELIARNTENGACFTLKFPLR
ncbi:MAG: [Fe-Fe] hydrogenase large subunit C-terminal domain-containing protein [Syntrophomonas sp.]|uniref:[Fe-Fe] hydrogenase large subunit C-terminal domain-containing protein n=1 Tax=Syntrophomonas sp. TaxID=2053627 RepID=UPI002611EC16|nr:[Fe-Fe] hydrogenase large subunit C-terminal domain-containing protein [Syntrophomonas sp.]MDD2509969.1 [Fe-Fe] hydrogenase large subunit C-terminal domain-containing protein [Syntrophomonas sp.]MDD3878769.1 [Fe-Fe] hydrogenase large subunit C-terminal domain-containing protein [Syntrophomonas sp.]MDD4626670.1 [Fe-Fe] hydrogenase large subunit C-terminal domain-containing protein [Syntrophomonas sp.]